MKGTLVKNENGIWMVKWSDVHSFTEGNIYQFSKILPEQNKILYIKDNEIVTKEFENDLNVEIELKLTKEGFLAKLIFPDVEAFEKEEIIKEYVRDGGTLWSISYVDIIRDGGTICLTRSPVSILSPFYIHKDKWTLHCDYPTTDENLINNKSTKAFTLDRLERYMKNCKNQLQQVERVVENFKNK